MPWHLPQHIYTVAGTEFGTAACSPALSPETVVALEARVQGFPARTCWGSEDPPFVVRAFPLPEAGPDFFAVAFLSWRGQCPDGRDGNFVAHSYVVPTELLHRQGWNLPWIAVSLPVRRAWQAKSGAPTSLPRETINLEPDHQFKAVAFAARELGPTAFAALLERIVEHVCRGAGGMLDLSMPPRHPQQPQYCAEAIGTAHVIAPDRLRLYRLAALYAVLPPAFLHNPSFSVNDGPDGDYALRVVRRESAPLPSPAAWPWLECCLTLALENRYEEFLQMNAWIARLLPRECRPSRQALDAGFQFYRLIKREPPPAAADLMAELAAFKGCQVHVEVLHDTALPVITAAGHEVRQTIYDAMCRLHTAWSANMPQPVLDGIRTCLQSPKDAAFLRRLPDATQARLWEYTWEQHLPPAFLSGGEGLQDRLDFFLAAMQPELLAAPVRSGLIHQVRSALEESGREVSPSYWHRGLDPVMRALAALARAPRCGANLRKELAGSLAGRFLRALPANTAVTSIFGYTSLDRPMALRDAIVRSALYDSSEIGPAILAEFAYQVAREDAPAAALMLFDLDLSPEHRARSLAFLRAFECLHPVVTDSGCTVVAVSRVIQELGGLLNEPQLVHGSDSDRFRITHCSHWAQSLESSAITTAVIRKFLRRLRASMDVLSPGHRLAVFSLYLRLFPWEDEAVFEVLLWTVEQHAESLASWVMGTGLDREKSGPVRHLARLLAAADARGTTAVARAAAVAALVARRAEQDSFLELLKTALKHERADGSVLALVRRSLKNER